MSNILGSIIMKKQKEVALLRATTPSKSLKKALNQSKIAIIAEFKRRSPSKGILSDLVDPFDMVAKYLRSKVDAISILTDETFFNGHIRDLENISSRLHHLNTPILRKDFIIDKSQLIQSKISGANAVLLIVSVLGQQTKSFIDMCNVLELEALVEVHDENELDVALDAGAEIIGINNRNLNSFDTNLEHSHRLITHIPPEIITVSESGIKNSTQVRALQDAGFNAVLIGESLMKSTNPSARINELRSQL